MNSTEDAFIMCDLYECPLAGRPFVYCHDDRQLKSFLVNNPQCKPYLVYKSERAPGLHDIIREHRIDQTFTSDNQQDLAFMALCEAVRCTHRRVIKHREDGDYGIANLLTMDVLKLLDQVG